MFDKHIKEEIVTALYCRLLDGLPVLMDAIDNLLQLMAESTDLTEKIIISNKVDRLVDFACGIYTPIVDSVMMAYSYATTEQRLKIRDWWDRYMRMIEVG